MADIKLKDKVNRLIAVVSLAKDKVDAKATKALDNVTLPVAQAGKALSVSSTGGLTYSTIGSTGSDANKANITFDNVQLPTAEAGKALAVSPTGGITYSTIGTGSGQPDPNKANVALDNITDQAWKNVVSFEVSGASGSRFAGVRSAKEPFNYFMFNEAQNRFQFGVPGIPFNVVVPKTDLSNLTLPTAQAGKALTVSSTGGISYSALGGGTGSVDPNRLFDSASTSSQAALVGKILSLSIGGEQIDIAPRNDRLLLSPVLTPGGAAPIDDSTNPSAAVVVSDYRRLAQKNLSNLELPTSEAGKAITVSPTGGVSYTAIGGGSGSPDNAIITHGDLKAFATKNGLKMPWEN